MRIFTVLLFFAFYSSFAAADINEDVRKLVDGKRFREAAELIQQQSAWRENVELRFLYARVLAWSGDRQLALRELDSLLAESAENTDFIIMKARLLYWGHEYDSALSLLEYIVAKIPDNEEAWDLVQQIMAAYDSDRRTIFTEALLERLSQSNPERDEYYLYPTSPAPSGVTKKNIKAFADMAVYRLNNGSADWLEQLYGVAYVKNKFLMPVVSLNRLSRFDSVDSNLFVELYARYRIHNLYLAFGKSFNRQLIPAYSSTSKYQINPDRHFGLGVSYKFDQYVYVQNHTGSLDVRASIKGGEFIYKVSSTFVGDVGYGVSNGFVARFTGIDKWVGTAGISYGDEYEVDALGNGRLYQVSNYHLGIKYQVYRDVDLSLTFVRHIQGSVYVRSGFAGGFSISL